MKQVLVRGNECLPSKSISDPTAVMRKVLLFFTGIGEKIPPRTESWYVPIWTILEFIG
jgi:hypothetical protein